MSALDDIPKLDGSEFTEKLDRYNKAAGYAGWHWREPNVDPPSDAEPMDIMLHEALNNGMSGILVYFDQWYHMPTWYALTAPVEDRATPLLDDLKKFIQSRKAYRGPDGCVTLRISYLENLIEEIEKSKEGGFGDEEMGNAGSDSDHAGPGGS